MSAQATVSPASILAFQPTTLNEELAKLEKAECLNKNLVQAAKSSGSSYMKSIARHNTWTRMTIRESFNHAIKRCQMKNQRIISQFNACGLSEYVQDSYVAVFEEEELKIPSFEGIEIPEEW